MHSLILSDGLVASTKHKLSGQTDEPEGHKSKKLKTSSENGSETSHPLSPLPPLDAALLLTEIPVQSQSSSTTTLDVEKLNDVSLPILDEKFESEEYKRYFEGALSAAELTDVKPATSKLPTDQNSPVTVTWHEMRLEKFKVAKSDSDDEFELADESSVDSEEKGNWKNEVIHHRGRLRDGKQVVR